MGDDKIAVYGAPWCPDCIRTKRFLDDQRLPYDYVDVDKNPDAAAFVREKNDGKQIIPTVIFPDGSTLVEPSNDELAVKLGLRLKAHRTSYDLIIIGGGPAGLTAAIYAAREGIDCLLIEKSAPGGNAAKPERIDNYPGFPDGIRGAELADRMTAQARRFGVEVLSAVRVGGIRRDGHRLGIKTVQGDEYAAGAVLIATGSRYRRLGVPGEEQYIGAGIHFCSTCDGPFYKGSEELVVIGGGNAGIEEAISLSRFAKTVRIIEYLPKLTASQILQQEVLDQPQFIIHTNTEVIEFQGNRLLSSVVTKDRSTGQERTFHPAAAFILVGLDPNTEFLKGTLKLDRSGFVVADGSSQTSLPGVFAAGDVRAGSYKQVGAAVGEGVSALLAIKEYLGSHSH